MECPAATGVEDSPGAGKRTQQQETQASHPHKKQKISKECTRLPGPPTPEEKSELCDALLSIIERLIRVVEVLRNDSTVPLRHSPETEAAQAADQAKCRRYLDLNKHMDRLQIEHAKAQVMLEQIRRCTANPYPAWDPSQHISPEVENQGPLVQSDDGRAYRLPMYTDEAKIPQSPYMAHYQKWLIPDPQVAPKLIVEPQQAVRSRNTSNSSKASLETEASPTHTFSDAGNNEHALDPLIMQNSKGEWVQLRCWAGNCGGRHDFKNMQGFINHRRTLHTISHPSHIDAADACGEPVELSDELKRLYTERARKIKARSSKLDPGATTVHYNGNAAAPKSPQASQVAGCVRLASEGTKSAYETEQGNRPAYVSTVHPFNGPGARLPTRPGRQDNDVVPAESTSTSPTMPGLVSDHESMLETDEEMHEIAC